MPVGTFHLAIAFGSTSALWTLARGAFSWGLTRVGSMSGR
jgi:hypothetical protein